MKGGEGVGNRKRAWGTVTTVAASESFQEGSCSREQPHLMVGVVMVEGNGKRSHSEGGHSRVAIFE